VTVIDSVSGETLWAGVYGRDGRRQEWTGQEPDRVRVLPALASAVS
jgi:hypothetical protein